MTKPTIVQAKRIVPAAIHNCPVCHRPQTRIQRRLTPTTGGSIIYVCIRAKECSVGIDLSKVDTWVAL
jgi:hypothetical protein